MTVNVSNILDSFAVDGSLQSCQPINTGHIHTTFHVSVNMPLGPKSYLLQQINTSVFHNPVALMHNVMRVTEHLRLRLFQRGQHDLQRRVLRVHSSRSGEPFHATSSGEYWRLYDFVTDTHTIKEDPPEAAIYEAAYGFGEFIALLADLPWQQLTETIPNFHDGLSRYESLQEAIRLDVRARVGEARDELDAITAHRALLTEPQFLAGTHRLLRRVTHNDSKISNILIDNATMRAQCVIDLDTVMPGLALYDFGDLVRTTVTGVAEDEPDVDRINVQLPRFESAARGFVDGARGHLAPNEVQSLLLGPAYMALIMAVRFMADYLVGDIYYRVEHSEHNLQRCRAQLALMRSLIFSRKEIEDIMRKSSVF
jgi:hypothetical protein